MSLGFYRLIKGDLIVREHQSNRWQSMTGNELSQLLETVRGKV
mgnify:CR=1 FL=1